MSAISSHLGKERSLRVLNELHLGKEKPVMGNIEPLLGITKPAEGLNKPCQGNVNGRKSFATEGFNKKTPFISQIYRKHVAISFRQSHTRTRNLVKYHPRVVFTESCGLTQKKDRCRENCYVQANVSQDDNQFLVTFFHEEIQKIFDSLHLPHSVNKGQVTGVLLDSPILNVTYQNKSKIIKQLAAHM